MKRYILIIFSLCILSCTESDILRFDASSYIEWKDTTSMYVSFVKKRDNIQKDTIYIPVWTIGGPRDFDRKIKVKQIDEFTNRYVYDEEHRIIDTVVSERKNKAIAGIHYIPFSSNEMNNLMIFGKNKVESLLPVILLRDKGLQDSVVRLRIELENSDEFKIGEKNKIGKTIFISDMISKPSKWKGLISFLLGRYSVEKHKFMNQTLGISLDNEWLSQSYSIIIFSRDLCRKELDKFNKDAENIKSGKAPLREEYNNPKSKLVSFPSIK